MSFTTSFGVNAPWCVKRLSVAAVVTSASSQSSVPRVPTPTSDPHYDTASTFSPSTPPLTNDSITREEEDVGGKFPSQTLHKSATTTNPTKTIDGPQPVPYGFAVGCANGVPAFSNGSDDHYSRSRSVFHVYRQDDLQSFVKKEGLGGGSAAPATGPSDELALRIILGNALTVEAGLVMLECMGNQIIRNYMAENTANQSSGPTTASIPHNSGLFIATVDAHNPIVHQMVLNHTSSSSSPSSSSPPPSSKEAPSGGFTCTGKCPAPEISKSPSTEGNGEGTPEAVLSPIMTIDTGVAWQCVEYARRWLLLTNGIWLPDVQVAGHILYLRPDQYTTIDGTVLTEKDVVNVRNRSFTCPTANSLIIYPQTRQNVVGHVGVISEVILDDVEVARREFPHLSDDAEETAAASNIVSDYVPCGWVRVADQNRFFHSWGDHHWSCEFRLVRNSIGQFIILDDEVESCGWVTFPSSKAPKQEASFLPPAHHDQIIDLLPKHAVGSDKIDDTNNDNDSSEEYPGAQGIWQGARLAYVGYNEELIVPERRAHRLKWTNHLRFHGASIFKNETVTSLKKKYLPAFLL